MTSGKLDGMVVYLAGPMEMVKDGGVSYRTLFKEKCIEKNLKIKFLDPTKKITNLTPDVDKEKEKIDEYRSTERWVELRDLMRKIVKQDLRQVDLSDVVIAFIDKNIYTCGTFHEIINCINQRKLTIVIAKNGKKNCPAWLFGIIHYDFIFDSDDEAIEFLVNQNNGTNPLNDKLILFRKELNVTG